MPLDLLLLIFLLVLRLLQVALQKVLNLKALLQLQRALLDLEHPSLH
jgi:hypothetical protein